MTFVANWNGDVVVSPDSTKLWSSQGGVFSPASNYPTYYPLPSAYKNAIAVSGTYTVPYMYANRPDLIAYNVYGAEEYWWLVLWFNGLIDPFSAIPAGTVLLVADLSSVTSVLSS